jgi:hypothetical protein
MADLTPTLNHSYYGDSSDTGASYGGAVPIPPSAVAIDGHTFLIDTKSGEYKRGGVEVLQQRNTSNQRDLLLLPQDVWRQQQESWHQGAGQRNLDREDALPYRFYRSFGVDPWTKYELGLLNETTQFVDLTGSVHENFLFQHLDTLILCNNVTVRKYTDQTNSAVNTSVAVGGGSPIYDACYDGQFVWTLHDNGSLYRTNAESMSTTLCTTTYTGATMIAYAKGFLLIAKANVLYNATALINNPAAVIAGPEVIYTSPVPGFLWAGACDGNNAIYLIGGVGDKYVIHRSTIAADALSLEPCIVAAQLPDGEGGTAIGSYLGYIVVGTRKGVRLATASGAAGDLTLGALIPTTEPVYGFEGQDRFIWATASSLNPVPTYGDLPAYGPSIPTSSVTGLYRLDLTSFTVSESTPAYAQDIFTTANPGATCEAVATWLDKRVFATYGGGVYLESGDKVPGGWLEQGRVSYSVEDLKTALYAQAKWEPLEGTVGIDISYDSADAERVLNWEIQGTVRSDNINLQGKQFSRADVRYVLGRSATDATAGPLFSRFEMRSRAPKGRASRWSIPLINHEQLDLNGKVEARNTTTEFEFLLELAQSGRMVQLQEWGKTYQVTAKDYEWRPEKLTQYGNGWQGVFVVILEEIR